jgi:hypothetical protein
MSPECILDSKFQKLLDVFEAAGTDLRMESTKVTLDNLPQFVTQVDQICNYMDMARKQLALQISLL